MRVCATVDAIDKKGCKKNTERFISKGGRYVRASALYLSIVYNDYHAAIISRRALFPVTASFWKVRVPFPLARILLFRIPVCERDLHTGSVQRCVTAPSKTGAKSKCSPVRASVAR